MAAATAAMLIAYGFLTSIALRAGVNPVKVWLLSFVVAADVLVWAAVIYFTCVPPNGCGPASKG